MTAPALGLILELTHRCPLRCLYCSNPVELAKKNQELEMAVWFQALDQAAEMKVLQIYLTGGEPCLRRDLEDIVAHASACGLYVNLITSGIGLSEKRCQLLCELGVRHIQLSFQDINKEAARQISGVEALDKKMEAARIIRKSSAAFTVNIVVHRENLKRLPEMIDMAFGMGADKLEVAHVQMNGWALRNREMLLPSREQALWSVQVLNEARERFRGRMRIEFALPDYYARYPKPCMNGWAQNLMLIDPTGRVFPCHSAGTLPGVHFPRLTETPLQKIWQESELFNLFRGHEWMPEICRGCERKDIDFGGCRCQALALTGDAKNADPVCQHSPFHDEVEKVIAESMAANPEPQHRPVTMN